MLPKQYSLHPGVHVHERPCTQTARSRASTGLASDARWNSKSLAIFRLPVEVRAILVVYIKDSASFFRYYKALSRVAACHVHGHLILVLAEFLAGGALVESTTAYALKETAGRKETGTMERKGRQTRLARVEPRCQGMKPNACHEERGTT